MNKLTNKEKAELTYKEIQRRKILKRAEKVKKDDDFFQYIYARKDRR